MMLQNYVRESVCDANQAKCPNMDPVTLLRSFSWACWKHSENQKKYVYIILAQEGYLGRFC